MQKLREWGYPVTLVVVWMVTVAYTLSLMIASLDRTAPADEAPPAAAADTSPAS